VADERRSERLAIGLVQLLGDADDRSDRNRRSEQARDGLERGAERPPDDEDRRDASRGVGLLRAGDSGDPF
jgi:hypothetical protein